MPETNIQLADYIREVPDFPKPGILFRDITPLLADSEAFAASVKALSGPFTDSDIDFVAAVEARGFIFGSAVARMAPILVKSGPSLTPAVPLRWHVTHFAFFRS